MRWGWADAEAENAKLAGQANAVETKNAGADIHLDGAYRLLSYILETARNKEELILPPLLFWDGRRFSTTETFRFDHSRVADWLETVDRVKQEQAETEKLTALVENVVEKTYGLKPKAKKSAK